MSRPIRVLCAATALFASLLACGGQATTPGIVELTGRSASVDTSPTHVVAIAGSFTGDSATESAGCGDGVPIVSAECYARDGTVTRSFTSDGSTWTCDAKPINPAKGMMLIVWITCPGS